MSGRPTPDLQRVFDLLLQSGGDVITIVDPDGVVVFQSASISGQLGYDPGDLLGESIFDFVHPADLSRAISSLDRALAGQNTSRIVIRFEEKSGAWKRMEVVGRVLEQDGNAWMVLSSRDVTESQQTMDRLKASERLLHAAFNTTNSLCMIGEYRTGRIVDVNDAWVRITGWSKEQSIGSTPLELDAWESPEELGEFIEEVSKNAFLRNFPTSVRTKTGELVSLRLDAEMVIIEEKELLFVSALDMTELEQNEARLRQSQRMEAIAQLTGGIAHDLNNMLTVVLGQIDLALHQPDDVSRYQDSLGTIRKATERGSELIRQLMIFSRKQTLKPSVVCVNSCVRNLVPLLEGSIGGEVEIRTQLNRDGWKSFLDEALLENALLNLCLNARDAMPRGGKLTLTTGEVFLNAREAVPLGIPAGRYIRVNVIDTGEGMDEGSLANAFEPYFTTKAVGQGTGLGLSMVFGFVTQSGGHVHLESEPGVGTTAVMYLPATTTEDEEQEQPPQQQYDLHGSHILVIEDNEELRTVVCQLLRSFGCKVTETLGSDFEPPAEPVDLILSDVVLPGLKQGPDLTLAALEHSPDAQVIFMSGYPKDRFADMNLVMQKPLLRKPFSRQELQEAIYHALED